MVFCSLIARAFALGRMAIDATRKGAEDDHTRPWPDDIEMDPEVVKNVRDRAKELGIAGFLPCKV